jgi:hypothetical protein
MPSIEIVAVDQSRPAEVDGLPFAVLPDATLRSHRSHPRFQTDFDRVRGVLYHLGNPDLKTDHVGRCYFAYKLLSPESKKVEATFLEFAAEYRAAAEALLAGLLSDSPVHRLIFTSDWQFGPEWTRREPEVSLREFWRLHDLRELRLNALYPIAGR